MRKRTALGISLGIGAAAAAVFTLLHRKQPETEVEFFDEEGNVAQTAKVKKDGVTISEPMPEGTYVVQESEPPQHES